MSDVPCKQCGKPMDEETWGAGAIIVRRPEAGDSVLKDLNILRNREDAANMSIAFQSWSRLLP